MKISDVTNSSLLVWAVWRSLDTKTGARNTEEGELPQERLARWLSTRACDDEILEEIRRIYESNQSKRSDGEPFVVIAHNYAANAAKPKVKEAAIWASLSDKEPHTIYVPEKDDWKYRRPASIGREIVDVIRLLMSLDEAPTPPATP